MVLSSNLPNGLMVFNLKSLIENGSNMNDFVGKICYIPDFQVGVPPNEVQVAWTFKQVRDLEIKTLGCALDENHDPSTDDNSAFIVELILGFEETSKSYGMNVFGEGFSKSIDFVWVAK